MKKIKENLITILVVASIAGILIGSIAYPHLTEDSVTITVKDKERIVERSGEGVSSKYLVFTDTEVFENTDCFVRFKFSSSDIQGQLEKGKTYKVVVYGWRVPFLSMYRNIISVEE